MTAKLFCKVGELRDAAFEIGAEAVIGRSQDAEVTLPTPLLSREHARIRWDGEASAYLLEDLGSANGTALDGLPVTAPERLERLHVITFAGAHDFIFQVTGAPSAEAPQGLRLVVGAETHALVDGEYGVGRASEAEIQIDSSEVSRRHALLVVAGGEVRVRDLGSSNGTFVDDVRVEGDSEVAVAPGARLRFGSIRASLRS